VAADVYAVSPHAGRGGWTWYTGAAGWLYRVGLENIAGFSRKGDRLYIDPCIPVSWKSFKIIHRYKSAVFYIEIRNPDGVSRGVSLVTVDGQTSRDGCIRLSPDGEHKVEVMMGRPYYHLAGPGLNFMGSGAASDPETGAGPGAAANPGAAMGSGAP
jgi:cellobiose phosphorylase